METHLIHISFFAFVSQTFKRFIEIETETNLLTSIEKHNLLICVFYHEIPRGNSRQLVLALN